MLKIIRTFPFTIITIALIWYLCFFTPPSDTGLEEIIGFDKIVHFGMYFFLGAVILWEAKRSRNESFRRTLTRLLFVALLPICMSGLIEILQENCTGGRRSGDVWDFLANSLGALSAFLFSKTKLFRF